MKWERISEARFIERPNRFIARVMHRGEVETVHVKNTGRLRELLTPGAAVLLQEAENPARKTRYDLVGVYKGDSLVCIDSQAANKIAAEYLPKLFPEMTSIRPEVTWGRSRFDFCLEGPGRKMFLEVKGVTLNQEGIARFPDAPTERGVKHLEELAACRKEGWEAALLFVVQMKGVRWIEPNEATHPAFGEALRAAARAGVGLYGVDCLVTPEEVRADQPLEVRCGKL